MGAASSSVSIDKETERAEYERALHAVEAGSGKTKTLLAWFKITGRGGAKIDLPGAVELLKDRVDCRDGEAMWILGLCYEFGLGCEKDITEAENLYTRSSQRHNPVGELLSICGKTKRGTGLMEIRFCLC